MALNSNLTPIVPSEHLGKVWRVPCVPCAGISMPTECATASVMVLVAETKTMLLMTTHSEDETFSCQFLLQTLC